jgi:hypothetical protein
VHFASFDFGDPLFRVEGFALSLQVVTLENVYGVDPARVKIDTSRDGIRVRADGLAWAGQQRKAAGEAWLDVRVEGPERLRVQAGAHAPEPIRCLKLIARDLASPLALVERGAERGLGAHGEIFGYPNRIPLPCLVLRAGEARVGVRVEDPEVREKRFAIAPERGGALAGRCALEVVCEEDARRFARRWAAPEIVLARGVEPEAFVAEQVAFAERAFALRALAERPDLPAWARDLALVVALHGMHWTGRTFLDYAAMASVLEFVCERIEGRRVLAYLPGWEGRYYWQYGDYRPAPELGGEAGFATLCERARALGAHVMPMFGANCVNSRLERVAVPDPTAYMKSATRNRFHGNQPDWDFSRAHDTGWQAWLNPGHPGWRQALAAQIEGLAARFGFDAAFLDTIHVFANDPDHAVFAGIAALAARLRERVPGILLAAEHDYDALLGVFPLFQRAWWTEEPPWTSRYALRFAHLCEGEPDGRTGVHEFGVYTSPRSPWQPAPGYLPTLAFQDDTLARSRAAVERAIAGAAAARSPL